ncbi:MAG TPA: hypothetical protein VH373_10770 [Jatrophihabitantaceae bacterium]|jgi:hypothetical protein
MLTDEQLTDQLRLAFDQATRDITPAPGLGAAVRRRHRQGRRRAGAVRVALPVAAAACVGGAVVSGGGHRAPAPNAQRPTPSVSPIRPVSYVVTVPAQAESFSCLDGNSVPVPHDAATWVVATGPDDCLTIVVRTDVALPGSARPFSLAGVPGLYETKDAAANTRTIYSRNADGRSWSALTVTADTPDAKLRSFYAPSN